jgi:hypothetical protein
MSRLKKRHHQNVDVQKRRSIFAKCTICESVKDLISKVGRNNNETIEYERKLRKHILHQELYRYLYHAWRIELMQSKDEFLCIIHDKMDHVKTALPRLQVCNKMIYGLGQLPITLIGMITHGHEDEKYAQYSNELKPNNPNFTIGSLLWILQMLEVVLVSESKLLFEHPHEFHFSHIFCKGNCVVYTN